MNSPLKPELSFVDSYIFMIRNKQIMIDRDLAYLYGVETKVLNQAVKRNAARFPEQFRFQLTPSENEQLVTNCDRFASLKHSTALPYAFTEQGVAMLDEALLSQSVIPSGKQLVGCNKRSALHRMTYGAMPVGYCALRGLIIDDDIYHIGASLKDLGKKWFAFSRMEMSAITMLARVKV